MVQLKVHSLPIYPPIPTLLSYPNCPLTTPNMQPPLLAAARPACAPLCQPPSSFLLPPPFLLLLFLLLSSSCRLLLPVFQSSWHWPNLVGRHLPGFFGGAICWEDSDAPDLPMRPGQGPVAMQGSRCVPLEWPATFGHHWCMQANGWGKTKATGHKMTRQGKTIQVGQIQGNWASLNTRLQMHSPVRHWGHGARRG